MKTLGERICYFETQLVHLNERFQRINLIQKKINKALDEAIEKLQTNKQITIKK